MLTLILREFFGNIQRLTYKFILLLILCERRRKLTWKITLHSILYYTTIPYTTCSRNFVPVKLHINQSIDHQFNQCTKFDYYERFLSIFVRNEITIPIEIARVRQDGNVLTCCVTLSRLEQRFSFSPDASSSSQTTQSTGYRRFLLFLYFFSFFFSVSFSAFYKREKSVGMSTEKRKKKKD